MDLNRITEADLYGQCFLKIPRGNSYKDYFNTLETVRSLVISSQWAKHVTGFFINVSQHNDYAVRLTYFTTSRDLIPQLIAAFVKEKNLQKVNDEILPDITKVSDVYGGAELELRKFLVTYTLIALDIIKADLLNARCLVTTFRLQVMLARKPYKPHFIRTFKEQSPFYNSLSPADQEQFWESLSNWPYQTRGQVDWAHMFVNMVLPGDWNSLIHTGTPAPLSIAEINQRFINDQGFQIPLNWIP